MSRQGKYRAKEYSNINEFWESEAKEIGDTPLVTIRDHYFRLHEINTLLPLIPECNRLLDIGCGTGYGTIFFSTRAKFTTGCDFSEGMILSANNNNNPAYLSGLVDKCPSSYFSPYINSFDGINVEFIQGNILDLNLQGYDVIIGQRILINLLTHNDQLLALRNLREASVDQGVLIITEATKQGHLRTDDYRAKFKLPALEKYWHNTYIDEEKFDEWLDSGWRVSNVLDFSTYALLSKVVYPAACGPESCGFMSGANRAAFELASVYRTKAAVNEIGLKSFLQLYVKRVSIYDAKESKLINAWLDAMHWTLPDWSDIGHQKLIIAEAIK